MHEHVEDNFALKTTSLLFKSPKSNKSSSFFLKKNFIAFVLIILQSQTLDVLSSTQLMCQFYLM